MARFQIQPATRMGFFTLRSDFAKIIGMGIISVVLFIVIMKLMLTNAAAQNKDLFAVPLYKNPETLTPMKAEEERALQDLEIPISLDISDAARDLYLRKYIGMTNEAIAEQTSRFVPTHEFTERAMALPLQRQVFVFDGWLAKIEGVKIKNTITNTANLTGCYLVTLALDTNLLGDAKLMGQFYVLERPNPEKFKMGMRVQLRAAYLATS